MVMELVEAIEVGAEEADTGGDGDTPQNAVTSLSLEAAKRRLLNARAARLEAEARLLDDVGAYYKGLAARAEAEADLKIVEKDREEELAKHPRIAKLILAERAWHIVKMVRRHQEDSRKARQRGNESPKNSNTRGRPAGPAQGGRGGRVIQQQEGVTRTGNIGGSPTK